MEAWGLATLCVTALLTGFAAGWSLMRRLCIRPPSAWVAFAMLLGGSLGAPAITYRALGDTPLSFALALLGCGFTVGATFWPMGRTQGTREWL